MLLTLMRAIKVRIKKIGVLIKEIYLLLMGKYV